MSSKKTWFFFLCASKWISMGNKCVLHIYSIFRDEYFQLESIFHVSNHKNTCILRKLHVFSMFKSIWMHKKRKTKLFSTILKTKQNLFILMNFLRFCTIFCECSGLGFDGLTGSSILTAPSSLHSPDPIWHCHGIILWVRFPHWEQVKDPVGQPKPTSRKRRIFVCEITICLLIVTIKGFGIACMPANYPLPPERQGTPLILTTLFSVYIQSSTFQKSEKISLIC